MVLKKYILIIFLILFNICCAKDKIIKDEKDTIVAKIGQDYNVTFKDLSQYVYDWNYNVKFRNKSESYKRALDSLIINQLKRFDFFDRGLDKDENVVRNIRRYINEEIIVEYYENSFVSKYVNEKNALAAYKEMDKEVIVYQIILPIHGKEKKEKLDSLKIKAIEIQNEFSKTNDAEKIVKKYSSKEYNFVNPISISWEQSVKDPVGSVVFKLKKDFTRVIKSIDGYYIVKVIDIKKIDLEPFEKIKNVIISKLKEVYTEVYEKEYEDLKNGFVDEKSLKWNEKSLSKIAEWSNIKGFYSGSYKDTIQNNLNKGGNFEILSYSKGFVDLKEYFRFLYEVVIMDPKTVMDNSKVKEFILEAIRTDNIIKKAKELYSEKDIFNPYTKNTVMKHRITVLYNRNVIENQIPEATEAALHKFYEEQKDSVLYQLNVVETYVRIYSDSTKAADEIKEIRKGIPFEKISNVWFNKSFVRSRDGKLNSYFSSEPPYLAETAFKMGLNEVAGPIKYYNKENGKQFAVIKCVNITPEKQPTYNDVKNTIKKEFKDYYRKKISDEIVLRLRNKYNVEIFQNVLTQVLSAD